MKRGGAFEIRLRIGFASFDVRGGNEVLNVRPKICGAKAHFGEIAGGGSDDSKLRRRNSSEELLRAGKRGDVGNFLDFAAFHPAIFPEVDLGIGVGKQFANGSEAGTAVSGADHLIGIKIVFQGPTGPNAGDGGGGVDEDAVHIDEEGFARNGGHDAPDCKN